MSKINLTDATTLTNETSFVSTLNTNFATVETASDNFLSLDGTSPNSMSASLDMNSNRIINLPTPVLSNDVVRLQDMVTFTGGGTIAAFPTTSAGIASAISDETGTGSLVFATSPTLVSPSLGQCNGTKITLTQSPCLLGTATNAGLELGSTSVVNTPYVDFHTSGNNIDYDSRITAGGGSGVSAQGYVVLDCAQFLPQNNDQVTLGNTTHQFSDLFLATGGVLNWNNGGVTITETSDFLTFAGASVGYYFDAITAPSTNDGAPLGTTSTSWSDLFLASGGVINFNAGNVTLTHASGSLTNSGTLFNVGPIKVANGTAIPAGGSAGIGYQMSTATNFGIFFGSSTPTLSAAQGSLYLRSDGSSTTTRMYVNTNGSTTWTAVSTVA